jgi:MFS transporter, DHA1 family, solute carrier family 18 (vesicular amine transporter), member 1/2
MQFIDRVRGLRYTTLVVVMTALFCDSFLYGMLVPLTGELQAEGGDEAELAIMYGGYALGLMLATPVCGILSDRLGRRPPLIWGVLGQLAATALFVSAPGSFTLVMLARIVQGAAAAATWTAGLALVAQVYTQRRTAIMGLAMLGGNAGSVLGPIVGGLLLQFVGFYLAFAFAAALLLIDLMMRLTLLVEPPHLGSQRPDLLGLLTDPAVLVAGWVVVAAVGGWGLLEPLLPEYLKKTAGSGPTSVGLMFTVATFFYGLAAPWVERAAERWGLRATMAVGLGLMALSLPLVALPGGALVSGAALTLVSVCYAFGLNPCFTEFAEAVERRGTGSYASVYAVYNIAFGIGMIGSNAAAGYLTANLSFRTALLATAALMLGSVPVLLLGRQRAVPEGGPKLRLEEQPYFQTAPRKDSPGPGDQYYDPRND